MKKYNHRISYATSEKDVYTTVVTSTSSNPYTALSETIDAICSLAVAVGELKPGEVPIGLSVLFVGEISDEVGQECDNVLQNDEEVVHNG